MRRGRGSTRKGMGWEVVFRWLPRGVHSQAAELWRLDWTAVVLEEGQNRNEPEYKRSFNVQMRR